MRPARPDGWARTVAHQLAQALHGQAEAVRYGAGRVLVVSEGWRTSPAIEEALATAHRVGVRIDRLSPTMAAPIGDILPTASAPSASPATAEGARAWATWTWGRAAEAADAAGSADEARALRLGAIVLGRGNAENQAHAVYGLALDEAARLPYPSAWRLAQWATAIDAQYVNGAKGDALSWQRVPTSDPDLPSVRWHARRFAFILLNPEDGADPALAARLRAVAAAVVNGAAWRDSTPNNPAGVTGLLRWLEDAVPAEATTARRLIQLGQRSADYRAPTFTRAVEEVAQGSIRTVEQGARDFNEQVRPPGGWGVGVLVAVAAGVGVVAWKMGPRR